MNNLKSGGTLFFAYEGRMGRAILTCHRSLVYPVFVILKQPTTIVFKGLLQ